LRGKKKQKTPPKITREMLRKKMTKFGKSERAAYEQMCVCLGKSAEDPNSEVPTRGGNRPGGCLQKDRRRGEVLLKRGGGRALSDLPSFTFFVKSKEKKNS